MKIKTQVKRWSVLKTHLKFVIDLNPKHILSIVQAELSLPRKHIEAQPKKQYGYK